MGLLGPESLEAGPESYLGLHLNWGLSCGPLPIQSSGRGRSIRCGGNSSLDESHDVRPHGICFMSVPLAATQQQDIVEPWPRPHGGVMGSERPWVGEPWFWVLEPNQPLTRGLTLALCFPRIRFLGCKMKICSISVTERFK